MALVVNTNIFSLNAQRNLGRTQNSLARAVERLSSGLRVNSAKDDAAGLAISMKLTAHMKGLYQAARNAQDGISYAQTAEGGMNEIHNILTRMRELAEQSATGTLGASERSALDAEFTAIQAEITRISDSAEFNGTKLLDGSSGAITLQVGINNSAADQITITAATLGDIDASALGLTAVSGIASQANAQSMLGLVDTAISTVSTRRGNLGAVQNRLLSTISNLNIAAENYEAANSRIADADFALETASLMRGQIILQAGVAVLAQANVIPQYALQLLS